MKVKAENIIQVAQSKSQLKCKTGAIKALADALGCSAKTVSRAIHGDTVNLSNTLYVAIRANAIRTYEGQPYEVRRLHL